MSSAVVVGVSPRSGSPAALQFAAREAAMRGVPLHAVMAWRNPRPPGSSGTRPPIVPAAIDQEAEASTLLRSHVQAALGDAEVECRVVRGTAVNALITAAQEAALLVVGEPRGGTLEKVRASLVAPQVVLKAGCPVVVMPATPRPVR